MASDRRIMAEEHTRTMNWQVRDMIEERRYQEAMALAGMVPDVARSYLGDNHPLYVDALEHLALCHEALGRKGDAEPLFREVLAAREILVGTEHPDYASALVNLAGVLRGNAKYAEAESLCRRAVDIRRKTLGEDDPNYGGSVHDLAELCRSAGRYEEAGPLYEHAADVFRRSLAEDHPNRIACLNNQARMWLELGHHLLASQSFEKVRALSVSRFGEGHLHSIAAIVNLAAAQRNLAKFEESERSYRHALAFLEANVGKEHPFYVTALTGMAALRADTGDFESAEQLGLEVVRLFQQTGRTTQPQYALALSQLAHACRKTGNRAKAGDLLREALAVREKVYGTSHPDYAASLHDLALYYWWDLGELAKAEPMYRRALEILTTTIGKSAPGYATALDNLAELYRAMRKHNDAEPISKEALSIRRQILGESHPEFASSLNNLAAIYDETGRYAEAEPLYRQALEIRRNTLGASHRDTGISLENLACVLAAQGRAEAALEDLRQSAEIDGRLISQVFAAGSERRKLEFMSSVAGKLFGYLSLILRHFVDSPDIVRDGLALVLRRKGIVAEAVAARKTSVLTTRHPLFQEPLRQLAELREQIARKALDGPGVQSPAEHEQTLAGWMNHAEELEADLSRRIPELGAEHRLRSPDFREVAAMLPMGGVLIEFLRIEICDFSAVPARGEVRWKPARYLAFTLPAENPDQVRLVDLGDAGKIDRLIAEFREAVIRESGIDSRDMTKRKPAPPGSVEPEAGRRLRARVFDPLLELISGCSFLMLAPDGDLSRLPFEVLPTDDGRRLIDNHLIGYVACGRDLLRFQTPSAGTPADALVIADPDFDLRDSASRPNDRSTRQSADMDSATVSFERLAGTRLEGETIARLLKVRPWLQGEVLERRLKKVRSPRILHLATHGFFLAEQRPDLNQPASTRNADMERFSGLKLQNPLLRSGLALAGGNTWLRHGPLPPEAEDGLLTAEDVSGMDLLDTELVVLSACDTGLGEIRIGEGVFGLRRAFALAGAKTLVMSLWKVPDAETCELMEDFYSRLLSGESRAEALRNARLAARARNPRPFFWGAFICQGNPGVLPPKRRWYYRLADHEIHGPVSDAELMRLVRSGELHGHDKVSHDRLLWHLATRIKGIKWPTSPKNGDGIDATSP